MRKRNCRVEIYFTKDELESLTKKVRKSGLSRESFWLPAIQRLQRNGRKEIGHLILKWSAPDLTRKLIGDAERDMSGQPR